MFIVSTNNGIYFCIHSFYIIVDNSLPIDSKFTHQELCSIFRDVEEDKTRLGKIVTTSIHSL